eukprot:6849132-Prymnesium_polylepis.1
MLYTPTKNATATDHIRHGHERERSTLRLIRDFARHGERGRAAYVAELGHLHKAQDSGPRAKLER